MIKVEAYGGGTRWYCTKCDVGERWGLPTIWWTNSKPPPSCGRCEVPRSEKGFNGDISLAASCQYLDRGTEPENVSGPRWRGIVKHIEAERRTILQPA